MSFISAELPAFRLVCVGGLHLSLKHPAQLLSDFEALYPEPETPDSQLETP